MNFWTNAFAIAFAAMLAIMALVFLFMVDNAGAQGFHGDGHDKLHHWYNTLKQPGSGISCCNDKDCRPTDARVLSDGTIEALKDGRWVKIPPTKILKTPAPDLSSHICAPPSTSPYWDPDHVYCFVFGSGV